MLNDTELELLSKFKRINYKGWIPTIYNGHGANGVTFENELGKKADHLSLPDYNGIELKCTSRFSNHPLYLFSLKIEGPSDKEIFRIVDKFGWYDREYINKKVLYATISDSKINIVNDSFYIKLECCDEKKLIYLVFYNKEGEPLERISYITYSSLKKAVETKLNEMAVIHNSKKVIDGTEYYRYYKIQFYDLIGFDRFLSLLKNDYLNVSLISRLERSGAKEGKYSNKGLVFSIPKDNIDFLFNSKFELDCDNKSKKY